jgi:hypothetical protein
VFANILPQGDNGRELLEAAAPNGGFNTIAEGKA